jgi:hypothetical protein
MVIGVVGWRRWWVGNKMLLHTFIRYLRDTGNMIMSGHIVMVQAGFKYNTGKGLFKINQADFVFK